MVSEHINSCERKRGGKSPSECKLQETSKRDKASSVSVQKIENKCRDLRKERSVRDERTKWHRQQR